MHLLMKQNRPWYERRSGDLGMDRETASLVAGAFAAGAGLGVAIMYILDPDWGRRRRALIRDQMVHAAHELGDLRDDSRGRAKDLRNRVAGTVAEARGAIADMRGLEN